MNKDRLKYLCHKISKDNNIPFNSVLTYYFLEDILYHLSNSKFKENFVYKGGYLLSNIIGISERTTVDIDLMLRKLSLDKENLISIFEEVLVKESTSSVDYKIYDISDIRNENDYGGYRIRIKCRLDNINQIVPFDISSGDVITYRPMKYEYIPLFHEEDIEIIAYNLETIVAEKLETIYSRGFLNTRMKDYYDLYIIKKLKYDELKVDELKEACKNTFKKRNTNLNYSEIKELIQILENDDTFINRWNSFMKSNSYLGTIKFDEIINEVKLLLDTLNDNPIT